MKNLGLKFKCPLKTKVKKVKDRKRQIEQWIEIKYNKSTKGRF